MRVWSATPGGVGGVGFGRDGFLFLVLREFGYCLVVLYEFPDFRVFGVCAEEELRGVWSGGFGVLC